MGTRAGIYARISTDRSGEALGVGRQLDDCRALVERRGWAAAEEYIDNDVSATGHKVRPEYQRMLRDIRAGRLDAVCVWDVDRLTRRPIEIEEFLELADDHSIALASVGGDLDIATDMGRVQLRVGAAFARGEVDKKARRQRRQRQQAAEAGLIVGGRRAFGYTDDGLHLDPDEAPLLAEMYRRFVSGNTLGSIARWLNEQGVTTTQGKPWRYQSVRTVLSNPRNCGLRGVRHLLPGKAGRNGGRETWHSIIGEAKWPAVVDQDTWRVVMAVLKDPKRGEKHVGNRQRYLLSGIAECSTCGEKLITGRRDGTRLLRCPSLSHVSRKAEPIEAFVLEILMARLSDPAARAVLGRREHHDVDLGELRARGDELRERKTHLVLNYADAGLSWADVVTASKRIEEQLSEIDEQIATASGSDPTVEIVNVGDPRAVWEAWPLEVKRQLLRARLRIVVHPGAPGRPGGKRFDNSTISVTWR